MADAWLLDELAHAGPEHLDPDYVAGYEAKAGYDPAPDVDVLLGLGVGAADVVVDLAAGTGAFARAIAPHVRRVVAVDVSPAMVDVLRARVVDAGLGNVDVVRAGFLDYRHDGPPAAAVFSRNALHQVPDFWKAMALARVHDLLRPGGVLRLHDLVYDFEPADAPARIAGWMGDAVADPSRGYTAAEFAEHVRTEHSTFRWLFEPLLDHAGLDVLDVVTRRGFYAAYTCRRRS